MNKHKSIPISLSLVVILFVQSCIKSNVYEKNIDIPSNKWKTSYQPIFTFDITDTLSAYTMFLTMRHTDAYPYSNIWLNVKTTEPGDLKSNSIKIEVPLAQPDGKWLGRGMNEIWEHRMPLSRNGDAVRFTKKGEYKIQLEQIMRISPLPDIMSIGIRLEKNK